MLGLKKIRKYREDKGSNGCHSQFLGEKYGTERVLAVSAQSLVQMIIERKGQGTYFAPGLGMRI